MINPLASTSAFLNPAAKNAYSAAQAARHEPVEAVDTKADQVSLSAQGRLASQVDQMSLESHRLPGWMEDLLPPALMMDFRGAIAETRENFALLEKHQENGQLTDAGRQLYLDRLANHSPANQAMHASAAFRETFQQELSEYMDLLRQTFDEVKAEQGIDTQEDYVAKVLNVPGDNQALGDQVAVRLMDDPRASALMSVLGIDLSNRPISSSLA